MGGAAGIGGRWKAGLVELGGSGGGAFPPGMEGGGGAA